MNHYQRPDTLNQAREFWATVVLHRWGILLVTVLLAAISVVVIALLPDSYTASTTVLFDPQKLPEQYVSPTVTADPAQRVNTLTQEALSVGRLQQIGQQLHLYAGPGKESLQEVVDQMRKSITIEMKPNSEREMSAFVINYTGQDPQLVAAVANRLAQSFIDWDLANREQQAANTAQFMAAQVQDAKQQLDAQEAKIHEYKLRYSGELPEQLQANMQALSTLHSDLQANGEVLNRLEQEKMLLTAVPDAARSASGVVSEHDRLQAEQKSLQAELANLRSQYTEQYPDVITTKDRLQAITRQLSGSTQGKSSGGEVSTAEVRLQIIQHETERLQAEKKDLLKRIDKYQAEIDAAPVRSQEFDYLERNYTNARDQYEGLLDKKFHADMAMDLERQQKASRFTVDPAQVPDKPIKPNRLLLFAMALPFSLFIPVGIAIASAEIRGTVNSERSLRSLIPNEARVLGQIPIIETPSGAKKRRRLAMLSILGSFLCCVAVAAFLWGGTAAHMRRNRARLANPNTPTSPSAKLLPR